jgi:hypothetical protein
MFKLSPGADTLGIAETGQIEIAPAIVVRRFGPPQPGSDGYKVSGEYVFTDNHGRTFVLHDWKATSLWDPELDSPEQFWASPEPAELSVSSRDPGTIEFERWLLAELEKTPS